LVKQILVTGSEGLIGSAVRTDLEALGYRVKGFDLRATCDERGDITDEKQLAKAIVGCDGVVHFASVSRVLWGERDPELCWATVNGLANVLKVAGLQTCKPWVVFASSREVYGQPDVLPSTENTPIRPVNIYGRSKAEGERLTLLARQSGLNTAVIRLSNVYGSIHDHSDRVVPAFAKAAALSQSLRVDGAAHTFDFTHVNDVSLGILALVQFLLKGARDISPIHFVSGTPTTLGELADLAISIAGSKSLVNHAPPRNFDVACFYGTHAHATNTLNWYPTVTLRQGLTKLIEDYQSNNTIIDLRK
jgi:nucleoside-diphosphate-sugar epimerase